LAGIDSGRVENSTGIVGYVPWGKVELVRFIAEREGKEY
jgi:hypothetical protein